MTVVGVCLGYIILNFFALYRAIFRPEDVNMVNLAFVYFIWFIFYSVYVVNLIKIGSATTLEVR